jgi:hypothetical protein
MKTGRGDLSVISAILLVGLPLLAHGGDGYSQNKHVAPAQSESHSDAALDSENKRNILGAHRNPQSDKGDQK